MWLCNALAVARDNEHIGQNLSGDVKVDLLA